jgi:hypothetical protein
LIDLTHREPLSQLTMPPVMLAVVDLADGAVVRVADEYGVEGPRPLVADGVVVGFVPGCSAW